MTSNILKSCKFALAHGRNARSYPGSFALARRGHPMVRRPTERANFLPQSEQIYTTPVFLAHEHGCPILRVSRRGAIPGFGSNCGSIAIMLQVAAMLVVFCLRLSLRPDDILATNRSPVGTIALSPGSSSSHTLRLMPATVIVGFRSTAQLTLAICSTLPLVSPPVAASASR